MLIAIGITIIYFIIIVSAIVGIIYFIIKRQAEKKAEKEILDRDDY